MWGLDLSRLPYTLTFILPKCILLFGSPSICEYKKPDAVDGVEHDAAHLLRRGSERGRTVG